jgi:cytochrome c biogenesis protein CcmG, thiol:disulfide interchange protein DsbE
VTHNTSSGKGSGKVGKKAPSGTDRSIMLVLAGFTALVIVVIAAMAVLSTTGGSGNAGNFTPRDEGLIPVGDKAPSFTAETVDGGSVSVGEGGGQGEAQATMLVFFATWCPHCQHEAPILSELESQYDGLRMVMIGIDGEDNPEKVREFAEQYGIESPAVYEPTLGSEYRVPGYPTTYVLDEGNEVVGAHSGEAPRKVYEGWIEEAL